jgi:hypothetical protein
MNTRRLLSTVAMLIYCLCSNAQTFYVGDQPGDYTYLHTALEAILLHTDENNDEEIIIKVRNWLEEPLSETLVLEDLHYQNGITIEGIDKVKITNNTANSENNYVFKIHNSSNIKIKGFTYESHPDFGTAVLITGTSSNIAITGNLFEGVVTTGSNYFYHKLINVLKDNSSTNNITDITIENNTFRKGGYHVAAFSGSSTSNRYKNITINSNRSIGGINGYAATSVEGITISGNQMVTVQNAVTLSGCTGYGEDEDNINIYKNRLYSIKQSGISLTGCTGYVTENLAKAKNIWCNDVVVLGTIYAATSKTLNIENSNNLLVVQNNFINKSDYNNDFVFINTTAYITGNNNKIYANNIIREGYGVALHIANKETDDPQRADIRYNNMFSKGKFLVKMGSVACRTVDFFNITYYPQLSYEAYDANYSAPLFYRNLWIIDEDNSGEGPHLMSHFKSPFLDNKGYPDAATAFGISHSLSSSFIDFEEYAGANGRFDIGCYGYKFDDEEAVAPMQGTYQVGTGKEYTKLFDVFRDLSSRGISGDVVVELTDGLYDEKLDVEHIPCATFFPYNRGHNVTVKSVAEPKSVITYTNYLNDDFYVARINNPQNITFQNIVFEDGSPNQLNVVYLDAANYDVTFDNCTFTLPETSNKYLVYSKLRETYLNNIELKNSIFNNGGSAMYLEGRDDYSKGEGIYINNSVFNNQAIPIYSSSTNKVFIKNNKINGYKSYGISFNGIEYFEIENNILESSTTTSVSSAMNLGNTQGFIKSSDNYSSNLVANNIIKARKGGGIVFSGKYLDLIYNTVTAEKSALYQYYETEHTNVENNIFTSIDGYAIEVLYGISADSYTMSGNVFYTDKRFGYSLYRSNYYFAIINGVSFRDIYEYRDWQKEQNSFDDFTSICANPFFYEAEDGVITPQSNVVSKIGLRAGNRITNDFYGNERRLLSNTPGAVETDFSNMSMPSEVLVGEGGFSTIQEALDAVASRGLNKDCTIKIAGGDYSESELLLHTIPLVDYSDMDNYNKIRYTLTIEPNNEETVNIINSSTEPKSLFILNNPDYVTIKDINFLNNQNTGSPLGLIDFINICDNVSIENCSFNLMSTNTTAVGIRGINSNISRNWNFSDNSFEDNGTGILIEGGSSYIDTVTIANNSFNDVSSAISVQRIQNSHISKNDVRQGKVNLSYSQNTDITLNRIIASGYSGTYDSHRIFSITNSKNMNVFTNIIKVNNTNVRSISALDINYNCNNINILHNTFSVEQNYAGGTGCALSLQGISGATVVNNILSAEGFGYSIYKGGANDFTDIRNNCYYTDGAKFAYVDGVSYSDFYNYSGATGNTFDNDEGDLNLNFHSFIAYPFLDEEGYSNSAYIIGRGKNLADLALQTIYKEGDTEDKKTWNEEAENRTIGATYSYYQGENKTPVTQNITIGDDYPTLFDALNDLMKRGVEENHISVNIPSGTYSDNYHIRAIPGNNYFGLVTINGDEETMPIFNYNAQNSEDNYIFKVSEPNGITFQNLKFTPQGSSFTRVIDFFGRNNGAKIYGCSFEAPQANNTGDNSKVFVHSSNYNASHNTKLRIADCSFEGNEAAVAIGTNNNGYVNNEFNFENNIVENSYSGLHLLGMTKVIIKNNKILNATYNAIYLEDFESYQSYINNNELSSGNNCLYIENNNDDYSTRIYNNVINLFGSDQATAVLTTNVNKLFLDHNTIMVENTNNNSIAFYPVNCDAIKSRNNIFYTENSSFLFKIDDTSNIEDMDYNIFHTNAAYNMAWGSMNIATQQELEASGMTHSLITNPLVSIQKNGMLFAGSPALSQGLKIDYVSKDFLDRPRDEVNPSIGAYELADAIPQYSLTITMSGNGTVKVDENTYTEVVSVNEGTVLHLEAIANDGWQFDGWSGDLSLENAITTITMDSNKAVMATFTEVTATQYSLTITKEGNGIVIVDGSEYTQAVYVDEGTVLNLEAMADNGWLFDNWNGDVTSAGSSTTTITMNEDEAVIVTFIQEAPSEYEVAFEVTDGTNPIDGATIAINGQTLTTNSAGKAAITLVNGSYPYTVSLNQYESHTEMIVVNGNNVIETVALIYLSAQENNFRNVSIYPNPFSNHFALNGVGNITQIMVVNAIGRRVIDYTHDATETATLSTEQLDKGVYLLMLRTTRGEIITRRIVKY